MPKPKTRPSEETLRSAAREAVEVFARLTHLPPDDPVEVIGYLMCGLRAECRAPGGTELLWRDAVSFMQTNFRRDE